jgi:hypothetical protein
MTLPNSNATISFNFSESFRAWLTRERHLPQERQGKCHRESTAADYAGRPNEFHSFQKRSGGFVEELSFLRLWKNGLAHCSNWVD